MRLTELVALILAPPIPAVQLVVLFAQSVELRLQLSHRVQLRGGVSEAHTGEDSADQHRTVSAESSGLARSRCLVASSKRVRAVTKCWLRG